ncbi:hypothetical protein VSS37_11380 [Candidatus Thiothrix sp. Deng01]|uniref:Periplasmic heavy metal sensor n=1 Tax=Candidatus Thiothrix phosphatis TaxID=3112415 RepID=A0ABU6CXS7_9GAMM|nr:hypothetical protein [Candidatus Thiothrix sp. Deng01]MEB4591584.1 hypothetical protein [Candidatus Thiothrix sp. Deng01]
MKPFLKMALLAGVLISSGAAIAASQGDVPPGQGRQMERMQTELGLTEAQVSQITAIETAQRDKMQALHEGFQAQIKALLTAEQAAKFEQLQQRRGPPGGMKGGQRQAPPDGAMAPGMDGQNPPPPDGAMGPGMGGQPPQPMQGRMAERMKTVLGLSDGQASQIAAIQQQQRTEMEALRTETQTLIKQALTAEQAAKFEQMRLPRMGGKRSQ